MKPWMVTAALYATFFGILGCDAYRERSTQPKPVPKQVQIKLTEMTRKLDTVNEGETVYIALQAVKADNEGYLWVCGMNNAYPKVGEEGGWIKARKLEVGFELEAPANFLGIMKAETLVNNPMFHWHPVMKLDFK